MLTNRLQQGTVSRDLPFSSKSRVEGWMALLLRLPVLVMALLAGVLFSQAPEFSQQYRQRIGGAVDELRMVVDAFEAQAAASGLDRQGALSLYAASTQPFLRGQGEAMRRTLDRYDNLSRQMSELAREPAVLRPLFVARRMDEVIAGNTLKDFVPAVPVDVAGVVWAAAGFFSGWVAAAGCGTIARRLTRSRRRQQA